MTDQSVAARGKPQRALSCGLHITAWRASVDEWLMRGVGCKPTPREIDHGIQPETHMIDLSKVRAIGISWYRQEDYERARNIMVDKHVLPRTYDEWIKKAERQEREWQGKGMMVIRAIIDPDQFPAWCANEGLNIDAKARTAFGADFAMEQVKSSH